MDDAEEFMGWIFPIIIREFKSLATATKCEGAREQDVIKKPWPIL